MSRHGPEAKIQDKVKEYAQRKGWLWYKRSRSDMFGSNGQPDGEFSRHPQQIFFIEFKAPGKVSTPLQAERQAELRACGFHVYEVDNEEYGKLIIDYHTRYGTKSIPFRGSYWEGR